MKINFGINTRKALSKVADENSFNSVSIIEAKIGKRFFNSKLKKFVNLMLS